MKIIDSSVKKNLKLTQFCVIFKPFSFLLPGTEYILIITPMIERS